MNFVLLGSSIWMIRLRCCRSILLLFNMERSVSPLIFTCNFIFIKVCTTLNILFHFYLTLFDKVNRGGMIILCLNYLLFCLYYLLVMHLKIFLLCWSNNIIFHVYTIYSRHSTVDYDKRPTIDVLVDSL